MLVCLRQRKLRCGGSYGWKCRRDDHAIAAREAVTMSNFPALEVVIGLSFIFFVFSLICSAVTEWIATKLEWRARMLEVAIENLFSGADSITPEGVALAKKFWDHPLIQSLQRPKNEKLLRPTDGAKRASGKTGVQRPSYIPSRTFMLALLDLGAHAHIEEAEKNKTEPVPEIAQVSLLDQINGIGNMQMREALLTLYRDAGGTARDFRKAGEQWFDDSMERVSGWYKRHAQRVLWLTALVVVLLLNIDTLQIGQTLWRDDAARAVLVAQADQATQQGKTGTDAANAAKALPVALGWKLFDTGTGAEQIPNTFDSILAKILGLLITVAALTLGAPFWFDLLSKFVRVRGTGAPPPSTDAIRQGEGEEKRAGDLAPVPGSS
jgi:hypothetical protein